MVSATSSAFVLIIVRRPDRVLISGMTNNDEESGADGLLKLLRVCYLVGLPKYRCSNLHRTQHLQVMTL